MQMVSRVGWGSIVFFSLQVGLFRIQDSSAEEVSFLFAGDVMGHRVQLQAAYDASTKTYQYDNVFRYIRPVMERFDFTIANLELTLAGPPYTGYPRFSSPETLVEAAQRGGIDVFVTANNHSLDRGRRGVVRTIHTLDSLGLLHTGTFSSREEREKTNLMILEKRRIRVGVLNYTYGVNGLPIPDRSMVNLIDRERIAKDIAASRTAQIDQLIIFLHWGQEYKTEPTDSQIALAQWLFRQGVDVIIGSHPHVLQKMEWRHKEKRSTFVAYSLGNFISGQRSLGTDGGVMVQITFRKKGRRTTIARVGYLLTWVYQQRGEKRSEFFILPCYRYENQPRFFSTKADFEKMKRFILRTRALFNETNIETHELYRPQNEGSPRSASILLPHEKKQGKIGDLRAIQRGKVSFGGR